MTTPTVTTTATRYTVSVLPLDRLDASAWSITVEWRDTGKWAVLLRGRQCLGADGQWDWEPRPSEREDGWLATHRFPLDEALRLAEAAAPDIRVNGRTAAEILEAEK